MGPIKSFQLGHFLTLVPLQAPIRVTAARILQLPPQVPTQSAMGGRHVRSSDQTSSFKVAWVKSAPHPALFFILCYFIFGLFEFFLKSFRIFKFLDRVK